MDMADWRSGKRRRYSLELKKQVLSEVSVPGVSVASVARRHGLNANLIFNWRRRFGEGLEPVFVPAVVVPDCAPVSGEAVGREASGGRMEVVVVNGRRIVVGADFDAAALSRLLDLVERR